jgi:hypothetical protein
MESNSEDPRKSRTTLRSVIDAFRGTPTVNTSVGVEIEEVGLEDEFDLASLNARNLRYARETDESVFETFERATVQEPQAWKNEHRTGFSTDPRRANRIAQKAEISDFELPPHDDIRARQEDFIRNGSSTDPRVNVRNVLPTHLSPLPSPPSLPRANYSVRKSLGDRRTSQFANRDNRKKGRGTRIIVGRHFLLLMGSPSLYLSQDRWIFLNRLRGENCMVHQLGLFRHHCWGLVPVPERV